VLSDTTAAPDSPRRKPCAAKPYLLCIQLPGSEQTQRRRHGGQRNMTGGMPRMRMIRSLFEKIKYELFLFIVLSYELCRFAPDISQMNPWVTTPYTLSYRFGFGSRFLVGSVIDLFTNFLSVTLLWCILFAVCAVLIGLVSIIGGRLIRKSEHALKPFVIMVIALFLASPASVSYLFAGGMFGRLETYHLIFVLVALCIMRLKFWKWLIPFLCILCVAIHQFFVFTFAPLLFVALLYEMVHAKFSRESVFLFLFSALALAGSFLAFQFFTGNLNVGSADEMILNISAYSNAPVLRTMLWLEYFAPLSEATTATAIPAHPRPVMGITEGRLQGSHRPVRGDGAGDDQPVDSIQ
jgi:hypothetical protein